MYLGKVVAAGTEYNPKYGKLPYWSYETQHEMESIRGILLSQ